MAHRYGVRPSDIVFDPRPDAFVRFSVDLAVASRAQADDAARYEAARRKADEEQDRTDADGGKNRKPRRVGAERPDKDRPLPRRVLSGGVGEAVDPALEKRWIELGGRPVAVEAKDTAKKEADFAAYISRRSATMLPPVSPVSPVSPFSAQNGHGAAGRGGDMGGMGDVGAPAEGQP